jgi:perosamine synthetase
MSGPAPLSMPKEQYLCREFLTAFGRADSPWKHGRVPSGSFFWARNALFHGLSALGISKGAHVLLPAYLCRAAVEPFEAHGAEIAFYSIGLQCKPDFDEIEAKITPRTEAILAVHYFGFPQNVGKFREICDRRKLALIEDCAHVLTGMTHGQPIGSFGDASVFSWRKFLPMYDGGDLFLKNSSAAQQVEWRKETPAFTLKVAKALLDVALENSPGVAARSITGGLEGLKRLWRRASRTPADKPLFALDSNSAAFDLDLANQKMSRISGWVRDHSDIPAIVSRRRQNFLFLAQRLRALSGISMLNSSLPENVCPWVFPLFFDGLKDAHLLLQKEGIPAVNWSGVRPPQVDARAFPDADFLYNNLSFLPVHQNLTPAALQTMVDAVNRILFAVVPQVSRGAA